MNILIAEDDISSQMILTATLSKLGHKVIAVADGREAWRQITMENPDVVVSDWMMPEMDGLDLCQRIRKRRNKRYIYFVLLTARAHKENYLEAMAAGVDDFFSKPLKADELGIRLRVAERILGFINQLSDLKRLLPICSYCRKVRDDAQFWQDIDVYFHKNTLTDFSHGVCPTCYETQLKPQLDLFEKNSSQPDDQPDPTGQ